jgi:hypothetical protein
MTSSSTLNTYSTTCTSAALATYTSTTLAIYVVVLISKATTSFNTTYLNTFYIYKGLY